MANRKKKKDWFEGLDRREIEQASHDWEMPELREPDFSDVRKKIFSPLRIIIFLIFSVVFWLVFYYLLAK